MANGMETPDMVAEEISKLTDLVDRAQACWDVLNVMQRPHEQHVDSELEVLTDLIRHWCHEIQNLDNRYIDSIIRMNILRQEESNVPEDVIIISDESDDESQVTECQYCGGRGHFPA